MGQRVAVPGPRHVLPSPPASSCDLPHMGETGGDAFSPEHFVWQLLEDGWKKLYFFFSP